MAAKRKYRVWDWYETADYEQAVRHDAGAGPQIGDRIDTAFGRVMITDVSNAGADAVVSLIKTGGAMFGHRLLEGYWEEGRGARGLIPGSQHTRG